MTKNFLRSLAIAALACTGATVVHAQTVLQLGYPSNAPGAVPCLYTTNAAGISADPQTGNLVATGDFTTGCPQTGPTLPLPVIVPGPVHWDLPQTWSIQQVVPVQWAAPNATSCTYGGSAANGWPSGSNACSNMAACETLHNVNLSPPSAGQYQFSLTCSNSTGSVTSTSQFRNVVANPPVITQGPTTWNVTPWTAGQSRTVVWSANNADNCAFSATALPSGVTLGQFLSVGTTSCSNAGSCALQNGLGLSAPVPGTYGVTLTCTNSSGGSATSTQSWNVSQSSSANCLNPASGWNRLEVAEIFNGSPFSGSSVGFLDATQFDSIFGRNYSVSGNPIVAQWPGVGQQLVGPKFGQNQYISAKFRTPATGQHGHNMTPDGTSFAFSGGGTGTQALLSATVSTVCGDFDTASPNIPLYCKRSQMIGGGGGPGDSLPIYTNAAVNPAYCALQPNTDYYLNLIYAPLTSPASANYNGISGAGVVLLQNQGVF